MPKYGSMVFLDVSCSHSLTKRGDTNESFQETITHYLALPIWIFIGCNLPEIKAMTTTQDMSEDEIVRWYEAGIQTIPKTMNKLDVVTIAAVHGHAIGAGCDLATICDLRIAADNANFAESFLRVGIILGDGGAWFFCRA